VFEGGRWACAKQGHVEKKSTSAGGAGQIATERESSRQWLGWLAHDRKRSGAIPVGKKRAKRSRAAVVRF